MSTRDRGNTANDGGAASGGLGGESATGEPAFSDLINRWLEEGDRLSETARSTASDGLGRRGRRRPSFGAVLRERIADLRAKAERNRGVTIVGAITLAGLAITGTRLLMHSMLPPAAEAVATPPPRLAAAPRPPAPAPVADPPIAVAPRAPQPVSDPPVAATTPPPAPPPPAAVVTSPVNAAGPPASPAPLPAAVATPRPEVLASAPPTDPPAPRTAPHPGVPATDPPVANAAIRAPAAPKPAPRQLAAANATAGSAALDACKTAIRRERTRDAVAACTKIADQRPGSAEAVVLLARAQLLAGRESESLRLAQRASILDPRCADAYLLIGNVHQLTGRTPDARSAYEAYLAIAPHGDHADEIRAILRTL